MSNIIIHILARCLASKQAASKTAAEPYIPSEHLPRSLIKYERAVRHGGLHRIYDDTTNGRNYWDGKSDYKKWAAKVKRPTIGYGTRFDQLPLAEQQFILSHGGVSDLYAERKMIGKLRENEPILRRRYGENWMRLQPHQQDALRSLHYNLGPYGKTESIIKAVRSNRFRDIPALLPMYNKADGKPSVGLTNRRNDEILRFNTPYPKARPTTPTTPGPGYNNAQNRQTAP